MKFSAQSVESSPLFGQTVTRHNQIRQVNAVSPQSRHVLLFPFYWLGISLVPLEVTAVCVTT